MKSLPDKTSDPMHAKCADLIRATRKLRKRSRRIRESRQSPRKSSSAKKRGKKIMIQWAKDALQAGS